jgi:hypothetical protein
VRPLRRREVRTGATHQKAPPEQVPRGNRCHPPRHRKSSITAHSPPPMPDAHLRARFRGFSKANPAKIDDPGVRYLSADHLNQTYLYRPLLPMERRTPASFKSDSLPGLPVHERQCRRKASSRECHVAAPGPKLLGGATVGRDEQRVGVPELSTDYLARRVEGPGRETFWSSSAAGEDSGPGPRPDPPRQVPPSQT